MFLIRKVVCLLIFLPWANYGCFKTFFLETEEQSVERHRNTVCFWIECFTNKVIIHYSTLAELYIFLAIFIMLHSSGKDTSIGKGRKVFFRSHLMYIHTIKRPAKRSPAPSLHKDSNLGVPRSPLRIYLRGSEGVIVW